jgi:hypothetical protein
MLAVKRAGARLEAVRYSWEAAVVMAQIVGGRSSNDGQVGRAQRGFVANHMQSPARSRK